MLDEHGYHDDALLEAKINDIDSRLKSLQIQVHELNKDFVYHRCDTGHPDPQPRSGWLDLGSCPPSPQTSDFNPVSNQQWYDLAEDVLRIARFRRFWNAKS